MPFLGSLASFDLRKHRILTSTAGCKGCQRSFCSMQAVFGLPPETHPETLRRNACRPAGPCRQGRKQLAAPSGLSAVVQMTVGSMGLSIVDMGGP